MPENVRLMLNRGGHAEQANLANSWLKTHLLRSCELHRGRHIMAAETLFMAENAPPSLLRYGGQAVRVKQFLTQKGCDQQIISFFVFDGTPGRI